MSDPIMVKMPKGRIALKWSIASLLGGILFFVLSIIFESSAVACTANSPIGAYNGVCNTPSIIAVAIALVSVLCWIGSLILGIVAAITWERKTLSITLGNRPSPTNSPYPLLRVISTYPLLITLRSHRAVSVVRFVPSELGFYKSNAS